MTLMKTSNTGRQLIKQYEGLRLQAYRCPAGIPTIGWGHTEGVKMGQCITEEEAEDLLTDDLMPVEKLLNSMHINFRQEQFDALASWIFNLGGGNFVSSTLCKRLQAGAEDEQVTDQLVKWVHSNGRPLTGLMKRRVEEANMFLGKVRYKVEGSKIIKI